MPHIFKSLCYLFDLAKRLIKTSFLAISFWKIQNCNSGKRLSEFWKNRTSESNTVLSSFSVIFLPLVTMDLAFVGKILIPDRMLSTPVVIALASVVFFCILYQFDRWRKSKTYSKFILKKKLSIFFIEVCTLFLFAFKDCHRAQKVMQSLEIWLNSFNPFWKAKLHFSNLLNGLQRLDIHLTLPHFFTRKLLIIQLFFNSTVQSVIYGFFDNEFWLYRMLKSPSSCVSDSLTNFLADRMVFS